MISLKDIAAACNVSVATVSKALNDQHDVSAKTKELVRQKAKELGYFPNSAAKMLKTNESRNIGVLFVDEAQSGLTHDYFNHVLDSFKRGIEKYDYDLTLINCSKGHSQQMTYLERARYRGFDGIAIACIDFQDPEVVELITSDIPVVTIDYIFNNTIGIISDNVKGMEDLVEYVYSMGHRRIAYIHGADSSVTQARLTSFFTTERPTCIFYPDDFASFGGINAIRARKLRIPEDISVVGYDGISMALFQEPSLTTLKQDTEKIGSYAAESLIGLIKSPRTTIIRPITVPGHLIEGGSVLDLNES